MCVEYRAALQMSNESGLPQKQTLPKQPNRFGELLWQGLFL